MRTLLIVLLAIAAIASPASPASAQNTKPNVLLLTADDMNYDTPGFAGNKIDNITPNLDKLAAEGIYFSQARVTCAVCQPSRSVLMTGRYPHRNGAVGFNPINADVPTLGEKLHEAGYLNGIFAKVPHIAPIERMRWDTIVQATELGQGRDPKLYYQHAKQFFEDAKKQNKPFFLMANSQDPHRPWPGSEGEAKRNSGGGVNPRAQRRAAAAQAGAFPGVSRTYSPGEVAVPAFLPDLPEVRSEMAQYYTSSHRCDEALGEVLRALKETGFEENTIVMFLSDNGISQPFAKSNVYFSSNRTPWLVKWPGKIKPGQVDDKHFVSGIDFLPTILEACGLPQVEGMDGQSFLPAARGEHQPALDKNVVTVYHITSGKREYAMRCISDKNFSYIYNAWSDGKTQYQSEPMGGKAFAAMKESATTNPAIDARVKMLQFRVPEEFYDLANDPHALNNLIDDPAHASRIKEMKEQLAAWMEQTTDPLRETFAARLGEKKANTSHR